MAFYHMFKAYSKEIMIDSESFSVFNVLLSGYNNFLMYSFEFI